MPHPTYTPESIGEFLTRAQCVMTCKPGETWEITVERTAALNTLVGIVHHLLNAEESMEQLRRDLNHATYCMDRNVAERDKAKRDHDALAADFKSFRAKREKIAALYDATKEDGYNPAIDDVLAIFDEETPQ